LFLALLSCLAGNAGLYVRLRPEFPRGIVLLTLALITGATSLAWYTFFEPAFIEVAAFAIVAWLGAIVARRGASRAGIARSALWVALMAVPLLTLRVAGGGIEAQSFSLLRSRWLDVLFSSWHGFLSWTPVAYVALAGTIAYFQRNRAWSIGALVVIFVTAWTIGASERWMQMPAFGARGMISLLGLIAPGLAYVLEAMRKRPAIAVAPLVFAPIAWNYLLMVQYTVGLLPKDEPVSFSRMVRGQADVHVRSWRFYPFAFPANVWFAWREGLPVDRYDLLSLEAPRSSIDLAMDREAERFLLEGWDAPGVDAGTPVWWIRDRRATVALPLSLPADRVIEIVVKARSRFEEPLMHADVGLQINDREVGRFAPEAAQAGEYRVVVPADHVQTVFRNGFNRIAFVSHGAHRVDPEDTRPPGPLARRAGQSAWPVAVYRIQVRELREVR
jgi:hypothetical protein